MVSKAVTGALPLKAVPIRPHHCGAAGKKRAGHGSDLPFVHQNA